MINGKSDNYSNNKIYYSLDGGVTWRIKMRKLFYEDSDSSEEEKPDLPKEEEFKYPEDFPLRHGASLVMDKDNKYFYIIGGKQENGAVLADVWKGFLNKVNFER